MNRGTHPTKHPGASADVPTLKGHKPTERTSGLKNPGGKPGHVAPASPASPTKRTLRQTIEGWKE